MEPRFGLRGYRGFLALLAFSFLVPGSLLSQAADDREAVAEGRLGPIEIRYSALGGFQFFRDGALLHPHRDLEGMIRPLGDYEANRFLDSSRSSDSIAGILRGTGLLAIRIGGVGLLTASSEDHRVYWITALAGGILFNLGGHFRSEAQAARFGSVQRYNRFARGEEQVLPPPPREENLLRFGTESGQAGN